MSHAIEVRVVPSRHLAVVRDVRRWRDDHGRGRASVRWEVSGDWREDPALLETEVFHALRAEEP